jgi:hypothetical protein
MNIENYKNDIKNNITNQTDEDSITPQIVGDALTDLADLTKAAVELKLDSAGYIAYTQTEKNKLAGITGTNTGDQDISGKVNTSVYNAKITELEQEDIRLQSVIDTLSAGEGVDLNEYLKKTDASSTYYSKTISDSKYLSTGTTIPDAYTKTVSDQRYLSTGTTIPNSYTKVQSDAKYLSTGTTIPDAYSKSQSDQRYLSTGTTIPLELIPELTLDKLPDGNLDINEFSQDEDSTTITINKTFLDSYIDARIALGGGGSVTPLAPTVIADDELNTLQFVSGLGDSEIVISINNGAYVPYTGTINVGNVARAAGYWKAKTKYAFNRNESAVTSSPAFALEVIEGETSLTPPVAVMDMEDLGELSGARNTRSTSAGYAKYREYLPAGATGYISCLSDGYGIQLDLRDMVYTNQGAIFNFNPNFGNGRIEGGYSDNRPEVAGGQRDAYIASNMPLQPVYLKAVFDADIITMSYSLNGVQWEGNSVVPRLPNQDLYFRCLGYFIPSSSPDTNSGWGLVSNVRMNGFVVDTTLIS